MKMCKWWIFLISNHQTGNLSLNQLYQNHCSIFEKLELQIHKKSKCVALLMDTSKDSILYKDIYYITVSVSLTNKPTQVSHCDQVWVFLWSHITNFLQKYMPQNIKLAKRIKFQFTVFLPILLVGYKILCSNSLISEVNAQDWISYTI